MPAKEIASQSSRCYSQWKEDLMLIAAGGQAGLLEIIIMHPLDTLQTKLKWGTVCSRLQAAACIVRIYKEEGVLSYWKGLTPLLLINTPRKTVKFFSFEKYRSFMIGVDVLNSVPSLVFMSSGFLAGGTEALVASPFEVIKLNQQLNYGKFNKSPSTWYLAKQIVIQQGLRGFYKGAESLALKYSIFNMIYFGFYHSLVQMFPAPVERNEFLLQTTAAFTASATPTLILYPINAARLKLQKVSGEVPDRQFVKKYRQLFQALRSLYVKEGFKTFISGMGKRALRTGSSGTISMVVFENCYHYIKSFFMCSSN